jgi:DNA adenine methylase
VRTATAATPFLKWAGGKRQLLPALRRFVPATFTAYTEAFLGSGALFFDLAAQGRLDAVPATLIDSNADLVGVYTALAREPARVLDWLHELSRRHAEGAADHYYMVRGHRFNRARRQLRARGTPAAYPARLAAEFLYLNRTCFNGLFRLNASGEFNVPVGRYVNPTICDERNLMRVAALLGQPNVFIFLDTFERLRRTAEPGEFIYFDPPYAPVSPTASFRSYTAEGFSDQDQVRLQQLVIELARRGCAVLVSNSVAPQISALYENNIEARRAGLRAHRVPARRAINRTASRRGPVDEYLISNV